MGIFLKKMPMSSFGRHLSHPENALAHGPDQAFCVSRSCCIRHSLFSSIWFAIFDPFATNSNPGKARRHLPGHEERTIGTQALVGVCLREQPVFPFSPSAFQASLQTSIFQLRNRATGAEMSLVKGSDVKNHLSPRFRTKIHPWPLLSQPDATGFSVPEPDTISANSSEFAKDYVGEHSSSGVAVAPADPVAGPIRPQASAPSKRARA